MSKKNLRKAYQKELAMALRGMRSRKSAEDVDFFTAFEKPSRSLRYVNQ